LSGVTDERQLLCGVPGGADDHPLPLRHALCDELGSEMMRGEVNDDVTLSQPLWQGIADIHTCTQHAA